MLAGRNWYAINLIILLVLLTEIAVDSVQIRVENKGGYLARILVRYENARGEQQLDNSGSFSLLQTKTVNIDDNAKSISIEVQMNTLVSLKTIFKVSDPCPHTRCFVVSGTLFQAFWSENCCR